MKFLLLFLSVLIGSTSGRIFAQDTVKIPVPQSVRPANADSLHISANKATPARDSLRAKKRRPGLTLERERPERRKFDSSLFSNNAVITRSDYLESMEKVFEMLDQIPAITGSFIHLPEIDAQLDEVDSALDILSDQIGQADNRALNIRNLQMFNTLLDALSNNIDGYSHYLLKYDARMDSVKKEIQDMRKDTLILRIFRDSTLKASFAIQFQQLKDKWRQADSLTKTYTDQINDLKARVSSDGIIIKDLTYRVDQDIKNAGTRAFGKERRYLWEPRTNNSRFSRDAMRQSVDSEKKLVHYYFANTRSKRLWLLLTGIVFFFWVYFNFRSLNRRDKLDAIKDFNFTYITTWSWMPALILIFSLAPMFDLHAPAVYIESTQFLLIFLLTILFFKRLPRKMFFGWCIFLLIFLLQPMTRILGMPISMQRWVNITQNLLSVAFGLFFLINSAKMPGNTRLISLSAGLYTFLNLLAAFCNLFGRVTLSQIFGATGVYAFAQTISLTVFSAIIQEAFLLQIQTSRVRKNYPLHFDSASISKSVSRFTTWLSVILWLIVFTTNLNAFDDINDQLVAFLTTPNQVGNFTFTLGGILLFLGIIWIANFLQKYIAYFFGDTGDDAAIDDRGQRSRLLVTRLILLSAGFLLAVAASGLPIDKITVILGALGVGIGLGLQSIVNNFVSGIILIFDRPLRIGDTVEIGDKKGRVKEIGIRSSTLLTEDGAEVIIPNGDVLSHNIVNWTLSNNHVRMGLTFTIDKPADPSTIQPDTLRDLIRKNENVLDRRDPDVVLNNVNSKTLEIKVIFWCKDISRSGKTAIEVRSNISHYLEEKGIAIL